FVYPSPSNCRCVPFEACAPIVTRDTPITSILPEHLGAKKSDIHSFRPSFCLGKVTRSSSLQPLWGRVSDPSLPREARFSDSSACVGTTAPCSPRSTLGRAPLPVRAELQLDSGSYTITSFPSACAGKYPYTTFGSNHPLAMTSSSSRFLMGRNFSPTSRR